MSKMVTVHPSIPALSELMDVRRVRLQELATRLRAIGRGEIPLHEFSMLTWATSPELDYHPNHFGHPSPWGCSTAACIAGEALLHFDRGWIAAKRRGGNEIAYRAAYILGLTPSQANALFIPPGGLALASITSEMAAEMVEWLADNLTSRAKAITEQWKSVFTARRHPSTQGEEHVG